jgi:hypothetical protein
MYIHHTLLSTEYIQHAIECSFWHLDTIQYLSISDTPSPRDHMTLSETLWVDLDFSLAILILLSLIPRKCLFLRSRLFLSAIRVDNSYVHKHTYIRFLIFFIAGFARWYARPLTRSGKTGNFRANPIPRIWRDRPQKLHRSTLPVEPVEVRPTRPFFFSEIENLTTSQGERRTN